MKTPEKGINLSTYIQSHPNPSTYSTTVLHQLIDGFSNTYIFIIFCKWRANVVHVWSCWVWLEQWSDLVPEQPPPERLWSSGWLWSQARWGFWPYLDISSSGSLSQAASRPRLLYVARPAHGSLLYVATCYNPNQHFPFQLISIMGNVLRQCCTASTKNA